MKPSRLLPHLSEWPVLILSTGMMVLATSTLSLAQTWSNTNATYPPGETQNWTTGTNWSTGAEPATASTPTINGQGYALINSTVNTVASFGVLGVGNVNRGLYIANGGTLITTGTFRLNNTHGNTTVEVASGGALSIGSTIHMNGGGSTPAFGRLTTAGQTTVNGQARVETQTQLYITGGNFTSNQVGNTALFIGLAGSTNPNQGLVVQTGGNFTTTSSGWIQMSPGGTYQISGGNMSVGSNSTLAMYFNGANATSLGSAFRVVGSGAQSINFGGLRYQTTDDQNKAVWGFNLDNSGNHITKLNFLGNGNAGGAFRRGTLEVRLEGGIMLSGTNSFVLLEAPFISTTSNYTNSADYTGGTAKLWTQGIVDSTRDQLTVTLNTSASKGGLDFLGTQSLSFAPANYGFVELANINLDQTLELSLDVTGGTLAQFTDALTSAGIVWSAGGGGYDVVLTLNPSISGGSRFSWDLASIDPSMGVQAVALGAVPEPSTWGFLAIALVGAACLVTHRKKATPSSVST